MKLYLHITGLLHGHFLVGVSSAVLENMNKNHEYFAFKDLQ